MNKQNSYEIAAYYFPNYHFDKRNEKWHGMGWNEWELTKRAEPRFEGHQQPKVPLWGYEDETDPSVMAKKIKAASDNGLSSFIFDWYWYEDGPFLQRALDEGFIKAENNDLIKFALMWANHDWIDIHPSQRSRPCNILLDGIISEAAFRNATDQIIRTYFSHPSYWRVNDGLYFSVYMIKNIVGIFGNLNAARRALEDFRQRTRDAGLGEIHLNAIVWGNTVLPGEEKITDVNEILNALGFDSVSSYVWIHNNQPSSFPVTSYKEYRDISVKDFEKLTKKYRLPYYPNVTMGWDPSPRTIQSDRYDHLGYPFTPTLSGNTPDEFRKALELAKGFMDKGFTKPKILTINAWNEWTEGSYLEPDMIYEFGYLDAIKQVFGSQK